MGGRILIIAFVQLLITLEHKGIFTSNKDYLTASSQTIHLIPKLTNLTDEIKVEITL